VKAYDVLDESLSSIANSGPELNNGLSNHAPMAIEALCAMDRGDAVRGWLDHYRGGLIPCPPARTPILGNDWRAQLNRPERFADWRQFFEDQLREAPWSTVLDQWVSRLAPGISASATHGVIRVGHAVRALDDSETSPRVAELANGLAYWASTYEELPTELSPPPKTMRISDAILKVATVPAEQRKFSGTITSSLQALEGFAAFAPVIGLANLDGDPSSLISEMTETFARVYVANALDTLSVIVFIHSVTSLGALRTILPHVTDATGLSALRYAWQTGCGLYAAFGTHPIPAKEILPPRESTETLIDMAVVNRDEHGIKFIEACLREYSLNASPVYLAAARHALNILKA
jgi:Questin oxidase-like